MLKKYLIRILFCAVIFSILIFGKVFYTQRSHYLKAEQYFTKSDWKPAMREYDLAMHFYTPLSPYIQKSAARLWEMGEIFEEKGKPDWAIIAYSSIRSSFYASRSLYTPGKEWIRKCDAKIADLNVRLLIKDGSIKEGAADAERKKFLFVLTADRAPDPLWTVLVEMGLTGWISAVFFVIFKGFDENGKIRLRQALYGTGFFCLTFLLWVVSLLKA